MQDFFRPTRCRSWICTQDWTGSLFSRDHGIEKWLYSVLRACGTSAKQSWLTESVSA